MYVPMRYVCPRKNLRHIGFIGPHSNRKHFERSGRTVSVHAHDRWRHVRLLDQRLVGQVGAHKQVERAVRCRQPVGQLVRGGRVSLDVNLE